MVLQNQKLGIDKNLFFAYNEDMKNTSRFQLNEYQKVAIESQVNKLRNLGFYVPEIVVTDNNSAYVGNTIFLFNSPDTDYLVYLLTHEVGHANMPSDFVTFDIWNGESCLVENWKVEAAKISDYATTSPQEFYAERFANQYK